MVKFWSKPSAETESDVFVIGALPEMKSKPLLLAWRTADLRRSVSHLRLSFWSHQATPYITIHQKWGQIWPNWVWTTFWKWINLWSPSPRGCELFWHVFRASRFSLPWRFRISLVGAGSTNCSKASALNSMGDVSDTRTSWAFRSEKDLNLNWK